MLINQSPAGYNEIVKVLEPVASKGKAEGADSCILE